MTFFPPKFPQVNGNGIYFFQMFDVSLCPSSSVANPVQHILIGHTVGVT